MFALSRRVHILRSSLMTYFAVLPPPLHLSSRPPSLRTRREDRTKKLSAGAKSAAEKERRLKRVKTLRRQLENREFEGVDIICTRNRTDTIKFLMHQLETFRASFDARRPPTKTRDDLKRHIEQQMKAPTFSEYLRLRKIPGIGDAKAMQVGLPLRRTLVLRRQSQLLARPAPSAPR